MLKVFSSDSFLVSAGFCSLYTATINKPNYGRRPVSGHRTCNWRGFGANSGAVSYTYQRPTFSGAHSFGRLVKQTLLNAYRGEHACDEGRRSEKGEDRFCYPCVTPAIGFEKT